MANADVKQAFTYLYAFVVFGGVFYALVIYPYQLDDLVKGALIGWATLAINSVFSDQVAQRTAKDSAAASAEGAKQALSSPTG
jgi:hypothetical protein